MKSDKRLDERRIVPEPRVLIDGKIAGFLEDLSREGAGLVLNSVPRNPFSLIIDFGKWVSFESLQIDRAEVIWSKKQHFHNLKKVGVKFTSIKNNQSKKLNDFLGFWENSESYLSEHIQKLDSILDSPEQLEATDLESILAQFAFLRVTPLSYEVNDLIKNIRISQKLIQTLEKISECSMEELKDLNLTIQAFEKAQNMVDWEMQEREEVIQAYEKLQDFMRNELMEKDQILEATQKALDMADKEKSERDKTIEALEKVSEMMRSEQVEKDAIIEAYEHIQEIYRKEILGKEELIKAYEDLQSLHEKELIEKDQIVEMHNILEDLTKKELLEKDQEIKVREMLSELAREEILERQKVITAYDNFAEVVKEEIISKDALLERIEKEKKGLQDANE